MRLIAIILAVFTLASGVCCADEKSDDTLRFYLSKSDLVVLGTIVSEIGGVVSEEGVPDNHCRFKVADVCKGDAKLKGKTIQVNIRRIHIDVKDFHPLIKKDAECILFLNKYPEGNIPSWVTADFWFGIQHPLPSMVMSLKGLAKEKKHPVEQNE